MNRFFISPTHQEKFSTHYANTDQNVGYEDGKVEYIRRGPNSPFEFGYSQQTTSGEANFNLDSSIANATEQLLKEYKDIFAWMYKDLRGIPPHLA